MGYACNWGQIRMAIIIIARKIGDLFPKKTGAILNDGTRDGIFCAFDTKRVC
jgi:hypothetical protein